MYHTLRLHLTILFLGALSVAFSMGTTFTSNGTGGGNWSDPSTWTCGCTPTSNTEIGADTYIIQAGDVVDVMGRLFIDNSPSGGSLVIEGTLRATDFEVNIRGNLSISGSGLFELSNNFNVRNGTIDVSVDINARRFNAAGGDFVTTGSLTLIPGAGNIFARSGASVTFADVVMSGGDLEIITGADLVFGSLSGVDEINVGNGSSLVVLGDLSADDVAATNNAPISVGGNATIGNLSITDGTDVFFGGTLDAGDVLVDDGSNLTLGSGVSNVGNITVDGGSNIFGSSILNYTDVNLINGTICGISTDATFEGTESIDFSTCSTVLPIQLAFFDVNCTDGVFEFQWETLEEVNNDYFTIEYSTNNKTFKTVTQVAGVGNSVEPQSYRYTDGRMDRAASEFFYFRLKQTDFDGEFSYSSVVAVANEVHRSESFSFYPNPVLDVAHLSLHQFNEHEIYQAHLVDQLTLSRTFSFVLKDRHTSLDLSGVAPGLYFLQIDGHPEAIKVIIH